MCRSALRVQLRDKLFRTPAHDVSGESTVSFGAYLLHAHADRRRDLRIRYVGREQRFKSAGVYAQRIKPLLTDKLFDELKLGTLGVKCAYYCYRFHSTASFLVICCVYFGAGDTDRLHLINILGNFSR